MLSETSFKTIFLPWPSEGVTTGPRAEIYRRGLRAQPPTPLALAPKPAAALRSWIDRDLLAAAPATATDWSVVAELALRAVTETCSFDDRQGRRGLEELLAPYLGETTASHFIHELQCFRWSPLRMEYYDTATVYERATNQPPDAGESSDRPTA
ncbi:unnamed protein product [Phaeothamnion confervicola]